MKTLALSKGQKAFVDRPRPEAMFDLKNNGGYRSLGQLVGPRNEETPKELKTAVKGWLHTQKDAQAVVINQ